MKLLADFHTHTKNSRFFHGKNTIEEMAIAANELGLKEIGITDHGYRHLFCTNKEKLFKAREIVDEINSWSKTKVLLGIEADIISEDGTLDIDNETLSIIDILLVGYHRAIKTDFAGFFGGQKGYDAVERATNAYLNAIEKYPVTILVHPGSILELDLYKIGCACRDKGVMVEISNRHMSWGEDDINDLIASGCLFVVSSDAHSREQVGETSKAFDVIKRYHIPSERIANVEFDYDERSEEDKSYDLYFELYEQKKQEKEKRQKELEQKRREEFSNSLSNEMEEALLNIAKDKGLHYQGKVQTHDEDEDLYSNFVDTFGDDELINQAKEYIANVGDLSSDVETLGESDEEINETPVIVKDENVEFVSEQQTPAIETGSAKDENNSESEQNSDSEEISESVNAEKENPKFVDLAKTSTETKVDETEQARSEVIESEKPKAEVKQKRSNFGRINSIVDAVSETKK